MNREKTIFVLEDSSKSNFGGGQAVSLQVINILRSTYYIVLFDTNKETLFLKKAKPLVDTYVKMSTFGRIHTKGISFLYKVIEPILFLFSLFNSFFKVIKEKRQHKEVILYATTKKMLVLAWLVSMVTGTAYIFHAHSYDSKNSASFWVRKFLYSRAEFIICVSKFVKDGLDLDNTVLIYNSIKISDAEVKDIRGKDKYVVAAFSNLIPQKGIEYLMKSYDYLSLNIKNNVYIKIYGEGSYRDYLMSYTNSHVSLEGFCEDVQDKLKNEVDLSVIPTIIYESFGLIAIESFQFGIPVICTNQGGPAEIVIDGITGLHVPPRNAQSIAKSIENLLSNPEIYSTYSKNALLEREKYNIELFAAEIKKQMALVYT